LGALAVPGQNEHLRLQMFEISIYTFANRFIFSPPCFYDYTIKTTKVNIEKANLL
jgi:hypothetical protein